MHRSGSFWALFYFILLISYYFRHCLQGLLLIIGSGMNQQIFTLSVVFLRMALFSPRLLIFPKVLR